MAEANFDACENQDYVWVDDVIDPARRHWTKEAALVVAAAERVGMPDLTEQTLQKFYSRLTVLAMAEGAPRAHLRYHTLLRLLGMKADFVEIPDSEFAYFILKTLWARANDYVEDAMLARTHKVLLSVTRKLPRAQLGADANALGSGYSGSTKNYTVLVTTNRPLLDEIKATAIEEWLSKNVSAEGRQHFLVAVKTVTEAKESKG